MPKRKTAARRAAAKRGAATRKAKRAEMSMPAPASWLARRARLKAEIQRLHALAVKTAARLRHNPPGVALNGAVCLSRRVVAIAYKHSQSARGSFYRHPFAPGVELYALRDGSILIRRHDRKPLHAQFTVRASE